jgi:hypothetical protein
MSSSEKYGHFRGMHLHPPHDRIIKARRVRQGEDGDNIFLRNVIFSGNSQSNLPSLLFDTNRLPVFTLPL